MKLTPKLAEWVVTSYLDMGVEPLYSDFIDENSVYYFVESFEIGKVFAIRYGFQGCCGFKGHGPFHDFYKFSDHPPTSKKEIEKLYSESRCKYDELINKQKKLDSVN